MDGLPVIQWLRPRESAEERHVWVDPSPAPDPDTNTDSAQQGQSEGAKAEADAEEQEVGAVGSCKRMRRAQAASEGDVFLARPDREHGKQPARKVSDTTSNYGAREHFIAIAITELLLVFFFLAHFFFGCGACFVCVCFFSAPLRVR